MGPNEKALRDAYESYAVGGIEAVLNIFADNVVWKSPGSPNRLAFAGERHGLDGIRSYFAARNSEWTLTNHKLLDLIAEDDRRFVVRVHTEVVNNNTGAHVSLEKIDLITMENGKCISYEEKMDTAPIERAARAR